jgi:hypothetical protein
MEDWKDYARDTAIRALDEAAERLGDGEKAIHRLASQWRSLGDEDKRELIEVTVAIVGVIGLAVTAVREHGSKKEKAKRKVKKLARKTGQEVLKKVAARAVSKPVKKARKKAKK